MATKKRGSKSPKSIIDGQDVLRVEYHPGGRGDAMEDALADAGRLAETLAFMQAAGSVHVTQHGS